MEKKIEMFQTLMKTNAGGYIAVLSDNSIDRDGEIVGTNALNKVARLQVGKVPILLNHDNKIENLVGEWVNRRMESKSNHTAFVAEPKFYMSNPKAQFIKGLLDDGAECGISIGAKVNDTEVQKINGHDVTVYTDIELLEASFVAIPSNRHGAAMAVAKSFKNNMEDIKMDEDMKKDFESKIEVLDKSVVDKDTTIESLTKQVADLKKEAEDKEAEDKTATEEKEANFQTTIDDLNKQVEELKAESVNKGNLGTDEEDEKAKEAKLRAEQLEKGFLPVMR